MMIEFIDMNGYTIFDGPFPAVPRKGEEVQSHGHRYVVKNVVWHPDASIVSDIIKVVIEKVP